MADYYVEELDEVIGEYCEHPNSNSLYSVLNGLFEGIEKNCSLPCPAEMDEDGNFSIAFATDENGKESVVALTQLDGERQPIIADVRLRSLVHILMDEECIGIVLNPGHEHEFCIPKMFLAYALSAGFQMAIDEMSSTS